jgi:hypothetical protein
MNTGPLPWIEARAWGIHGRPRGARQIAAEAPYGGTPVIAYGIQAPSLGVFHHGRVRRLDDQR